MTNRIPSEVFSLSPTLTGQQKSHNTERAGSVDSLLSLPRRKKSPRSIRRNLDLYIPPSISEGGHKAQWNVKGGTAKREALVFWQLQVGSEGDKDNKDKDEDG
jgi:hypothetical protein